MKQLDYVYAMMYGLVAFVVGSILMAFMNIVRGPMDHNSIEASVFDTTLVQYFTAHGINVASYKDKYDENPIMNSWWDFKYSTDYGGLFVQPSTINMSDYLSLDQYMRSDMSIQLMSSYNVGPLPNELIFYSIPPIVLLGFGALATYHLTSDYTYVSGMVIGGSIVAGYLLLTIIGTFTASILVFRRFDMYILLFPDPIQAIVRMGLIYPIILGSAGGLIFIFLYQNGIVDGEKSI